MGRKNYGYLGKGFSIGILEAGAHTSDLGHNLKPLTSSRAKKRYTKTGRGIGRDLGVLRRRRR